MGTILEAVQVVIQGVFGELLKSIQLGNRVNITSSENLFKLTMV